jgi:hypothetical protein
VVYQKLTQVKLYLEAWKATSKHTFNFSLLSLVSFFAFTHHLITFGIEVLSDLVPIGTKLFDLEGNK